MGLIGGLLLLGVTFWPQLPRDTDLEFILGPDHGEIIEAGSHEELIQIGKPEFMLLFDQNPHAVISLSHENYSVLHADELRGVLH